MAATIDHMTLTFRTDDLARLGGRNVSTDGNTVHAHFDDGRLKRWLIVSPHHSGAVLYLCRWDYCEGRYVICGCRIVPNDQIMTGAAELLATHLPDWQPRR
jgi:hypothetical protein